MTNPIINGGFELDLSAGWNDLYAGTIRDASEHHTGSYSAKFPNSSGSAIYQTFSPVEQTDITTFEMYFKTSNFSPAYGFGAWILYEGWTPGDGNPAHHTVIEIYTQLSWSQFDLMSRLESYKGKVIGIQLQSVGAADYWVDDVYLEYSSITISVDSQAATDYIASTKATLHGTVSGTAGVNITKVGFDYKDEGDPDWTSIVTDVTEVIPYIFSQKITGRNYYEKFSFRAKVYAEGEWHYGWVLYILVPDGPLARVESVYVKGTTLRAVTSATFGSNDRKTRLPIPMGDMLFHELIPNLIEGEIVCYDVTSIWTAFYTSGIIDEPTGDTTKFSTDGTEFVITLRDIFNNFIIFSFWDVRVVPPQLVSPELESGGEGKWIIKFTAKSVIKS
jgi:hypothetical protein